MVACSPDGHLAITASPLGSVDVWDMHRRALLRTAPAPKLTACIAYSRGGSVAAIAGEDCHVRILEAVTCREVRSFPKVHAVGCIAFAADDHVLVAAEQSGEIEIWDVDSGRELTTIRGSAAPVVALASSPGGALFATMDSRGEIRLREVGAYTLRFSAQDGNAFPSALAYSPDGGTIASSGDPGVITVWDATVGTRRARWSNGASVTSLSFTSPRVLVSAASDSTVRFWDVKTRRLLFQVEPDEAPAQALGVGAATKALVAVCMGRVYLLSPPAEAWLSVR